MFEKIISDIEETVGTLPVYSHVPRPFVVLKSQLNKARAAARYCERVFSVLRDPGFASVMGEDAPALELGQLVTRLWERMTNAATLQALILQLAKEDGIRPREDLPDSSKWLDLLNRIASHNDELIAAQRRQLQAMFRELEQLRKTFNQHNHVVPGPASPPPPVVGDNGEASVQRHVRQTEMDSKRILARWLEAKPSTVLPGAVPGSYEFQGKRLAVVDVGLNDFSGDDICADANHTEEYFGLGERTPAHGTR